MTMTIAAENAATSKVSIITSVDASAVDRATASVRPMPRPIAHSSHRLLQDQADDPCGALAERPADADFLRPPRDGVGEHRTNSFSY
jgi:hypothetical protein